MSANSLSHELIHNGDGAPKASRCAMTERSGRLWGATVGCCRCFVSKHADSMAQVASKGECWRPEREKLNNTRLRYESCCLVGEMCCGSGSGGGGKNEDGDSKSDRQAGML